MRASQVLQRCLPHSLSLMHALRERALLCSVEALLQGRRLTLMDVARAWPNATRVRAPLKAFDRLLSNRHLHAERTAIDREMARWLSTLASFASWVAGLGCEATGVAQWLLPHRAARKLYSTMRVGREALVRGWPLEPPAHN